MRSRRSRPATSTRAAKQQSGWQKCPPSPPMRPDPATVSTTALPEILLPPRSRFASARAIDERCGTEAGQNVHQQYFAATCFDDLAADDLLAGVIPALHQHARLDLRNHPDRRIFFEDGDKID